jgi:hypothetical protein
MTLRSTSFMRLTGLHTLSQYRSQRAERASSPNLLLSAPCGKPFEASVINWLFGRDRSRRIDSEQASFRTPAQRVSFRARANGTPISVSSRPKRGRGPFISDSSRAARKDVPLFLVPSRRPASLAERASQIGSSRRGAGRSCLSRVTGLLYPAAPSECGAEGSGRQGTQPSKLHGARTRNTSTTGDTSSTENRNAR